MYVVCQFIQWEFILWSLTQKKLAHPIECLSLTLEEVTHIRQVLTKAELETLITNHEMYNLVSKGKVRTDVADKSVFNGVINNGVIINGVTNKANRIVKPWLNQRHFIHDTWLREFLVYFLNRCALPVNWSSSPCLVNGELDARSVNATFATTVSER